VALVAPEQNGEPLYEASFDAPCHPRHSGKVRVPRRSFKRGVFPSLPLCPLFF